MNKGLTRICKVLWKVLFGIDHFRYLLLKNEIPFFDFFNSLNAIEKAVFNLKRCYLKDYQRELKRLKEVVDSIM
jgi:hypothetical protein